MSSVQEVYQTLMEVDKLLEGIELKITQITGESAGGAKSSSGGSLAVSLQKQVRILNMMMIVLTQMTGNENIDKAMQKFQQLTMTLLRLRMAMLAVQAAMAGGLGPVGWLYAGVTMLSAGVSAGSIYTSNVGV